MHSSTTSGDVWPCPFARWMWLGSVHRSSLATIYAGTEARKARRVLRWVPREHAVQPGHRHVQGVASSRTVDRADKAGRPHRRACPREPRATHRGMASGRFHPDGVGFMPMSGHAPRKPSWESLLPLVRHDGLTRRRRHSRTIVQGDGAGAAFWSLVQLLVIPFERLFPAGPGEGAIVDLTDHSWVRLELDGDGVTQGGPRRLWDLIERLYDLWLDPGWSPARPLRPHRH
jgi:hypothetical protein